MDRNLNLLRWLSARERDLGSTVSEIQERISKEVVLPEGYRIEYAGEFEDEDYEAELDSKVADIKQCTMAGEADHILATRFLRRFVEHDTPWLHVDLSASSCKGGLGAVASDLTGFGVGWGLYLLKHTG